jgi:hypothetical protein
LPLLQLVQLSLHGLVACIHGGLSCGIH